MLKFAADENFNNDIVRGLLRRNPDLDIVRVQDAGLSETDAPTILEWAALEGRVFLTHDVSTITRYAYERVGNGLPMPGVFEVTRKVPVGLAIDEILLLAECSVDGEWEGRFAICRFVNGAIEPEVCQRALDYRLATPAPPLTTKPVAWTRGAAGLSGDPFARGVKRTRAGAPRRCNDMGPPNREARRDSTGMVRPREYA